MPAKAAAQRRQPVAGSVPAKLQSAQNWLGSAVLTSYNLLQLLLWGRVAVGLVLAAARTSAQDGSAADKVAFLCRSIYSACGRHVVIAQQVSCLEIAFVMAGFLKTPLLSIVMQLLARNIVILFTIQYAADPVVLESPAILICFVAWTLADLPRFAWLLWKNVTDRGAVLQALTAVRYSSFIVLYPLGGVGEFWSMYNALGLGIRRNLLDVGVRLQQELWVDMDVVIKYVYMPLFIPGFLFLYFNMLRARKRRNGKTRGGQQHQPSEAAAAHAKNK